MMNRTGSRFGFDDVLSDAVAEPAPQQTNVLSREEIKQKTDEAARSVGHVAPDPKDAVPPPPVKRTRIRRPARTEETVTKSRGRPKGKRNVPLSVKIRQEHDDLIKAIAGDDFTVAAVMEEAIIAFAMRLYKNKKYKRMPLDEKTIKMARALYAEETDESDA